MILFSRPEFDCPTKHASEWAKKLLLFARKKNFTVGDLFRNKANKKNIESYIKKEEY